MSRGRHRRTLWSRWRRRRKLPESFPIVGGLFAFLIGICIMGFILSPSGEKGSEPAQVRPTIGSPSDTPSDSGLVGS